MALQPLRIPFFYGNDDQASVRRNFLEVERFLKGFKLDPVTGLYTLGPDLIVTNRILAQGNNASAVFSFSEALQTAGAFSGLHMADRDNQALRWVLYPNGGRLRIYDGTADLFSIDRTTGLIRGIQTLMGPWPNDGTYAFFSNAFSSASGDYALLQANDGSTFLNSSSNKNINFRSNNQNRMIMGTNGQFLGPLNLVNGLGGTFAEIIEGASLAGSGAVVNHIVQAGTVVVNFVAGNGNFNWPITFPHGVSSAVVSNGDSGGSAGGAFALLSTSGTGTVGTGVSCANTSNNTFIGGNVRINYVAVGW